ncbi:MAG: UvrB/UvrC motif-containing protein, partial [Pseudomonadota bacterium]|nr:UvrB/UvrC motif-containing protein [Pseudomonadota bacterium]
NLLREGLDIPECMLVAILDADKEGYLRSRTSLIQTIGRAARNVDGRVILYADRETGSMQAALEETARRRERQIEYNIANGITPESVKKNIGDVMNSAYERADHLTVPKVKGLSDQEQAALETPAGMRKYIEKQQKKMLKAAENLEFEEAARLRDEIRRLEQAELGLK